MSRWWSWVAAAALSALQVACPRAIPGRAPDAAVVLEVGAPASTARVLVSADGRPVAVLAEPVPRGGFSGWLAVAPGPHEIALEAVDARGNRLVWSTVALTVSRGEAAQIAGSLRGAAPAATGPGPGLLLAAPRSSVVAGESMRVLSQAQAGDPPGAEFAWAAEPPGCGRFSAPSAAATGWTATSAGTCTLTFSATAGGRTVRQSVSVMVRTGASGARFPLRLAASGRYLVDRQGAPFLLKGEAAWLALVNLTEEEQERYLADRAARGFNLVEVMLMNHDYTSSPSPTPPANRYGEVPFAGPGFSHLGEAYFDRVVQFVDRAGERGIAVLVAPSYLGFDGGREGWWGLLGSAESSRADCFAFGRHVGERLRDRANVLWLAGGDFAPPPGSEGEARHLEILRGVKAAGAAQLWTGHWNVGDRGGISTDQAAFSAAMDLDGVYQYALPYRYAGRAYDARPPRPVFLLESAYEHEHPGTELQPFRKAWWWTMLTGGTGVIWGNTFLWMAESARGTHAADYGDTDRAVSSWAAELDSPGTHQMVHLHSLFEAIPWWRLVPSGPASGRAPLVTAGWGLRRSEQIAAAATPEGDLVVAYLPPSWRRARRFALDLSGMRGPVRARWYDPSLGAFVGVRDGLPASRGVAFETPGSSADGQNDWVLVVDGRPEPL